MAYNSEKDIQWRNTPVFNLNSGFQCDNAYMSDSGLVMHEGGSASLSVNTSGTEKADYGKLIVHLSSNDRSLTSEDAKPVVAIVKLYYDNGDNATEEYFPCYEFESKYEGDYIIFSLLNKPVISVSVSIRSFEETDVIITNTELYFNYTEKDEITYSMGNMISSMLPSALEDYIDEHGIPGCDCKAQLIIPLLKLTEYQKYETDTGVPLEDGSIWRAEWHEDGDGTFRYDKLTATVDDPLSSILQDINRYVENHDGDIDIDKDTTLQGYFDKLDDYTSEGTNKNDNDTVKKFIAYRQDNEKFSDVLDELEEYLPSDEEQGR